MKILKTLHASAVKRNITETLRVKEKKKKKTSMKFMGLSV